MTRFLLALLLLPALAFSADDHAANAPGQSKEAAPKLDDAKQTDLVKAAFKAFAEFRDALEDVKKSGYFEYQKQGKKLTPEMKAAQDRSVQASEAFAAAQRAALIDYFKEPRRRARWSGDKDGDTFATAIASYSAWSGKGHPNDPQAAGLAYGNKHHIVWLSSLCSGRDENGH